MQASPGVSPRKIAAKPNVFPREFAAKPYVFPREFAASPLLSRSVPAFAKKKAKAGPSLLRGGRTKSPRPRKKGSARSGSGRRPRVPRVATLYAAATLEGCGCRRTFFYKIASHRENETHAETQNNGYAEKGGRRTDPRSGLLRRPLRFSLSAAPLFRLRQGTAAGGRTNHHPALMAAKRRPLTGGNKVFFGGASIKNFTQRRLFSAGFAGTVFAEKMQKLFRLGFWRKAIGNFLEDIRDCRFF